MEYTYLLELADECEDPHMRLVYAGNTCIYHRNSFGFNVYSTIALTNNHAFLQLLGSYLFIRQSRGRGSLLIRFSEKHMNW